MKTQPMQPIVRDERGVVRFQENGIVRWLLDSGRVSLNDVARGVGNFSPADVEQFWQLIGYSVSGYGDLSFVRRETIERADEAALHLVDRAAPAAVPFIPAVDLDFIREHVAKMSAALESLRALIPPDIESGEPPR